MVYTPPATKKLSELEIDTNKDWLGYVIKNLGKPSDINDVMRLISLVQIRSNNPSGIYIDEENKKVCIYQLNKLDWFTSCSTIRRFGFGTYITKGFIVLPESYKEYYLGMEKYAGAASKGAAFFFNLGSSYETKTYWNGSGTTVTLSGQDWTTEREFKIVWDSSKVDFYVGGVLVSSHTTDVPQDPMTRFIEINNSESNAPANPGRICVDLDWVLG